MTDAQTGSLEAALARTERMLETRPDLVELQAREIVNAVPGHPAALLLIPYILWVTFASALNFWIFLLNK